MNALFSTISDNFFIPLSSKNKIVYWECICKLFSVMDNQLSFGVERDVLVDELQYYFEQKGAADLDEEEFSEKDSRAKANEMLRRLEFYGWIEIETDKSYIQRVNFKEYAIRILKTLLEIADGKQVEYQGYIYTIYSLVRSQTDNPGVVLIQIMENTDLLITGLKNLSSSIKHYIDDLTRHSTVAEIMDALFNDYITNIVDRAYHRLLTSDNVSKFRPEIIERLESRSKSEAYMNQTVKEITALKEIEEEEAKEFIYRCLHEVIEAFRNMDDILNEINKKNSQYQRAAINRARFLLTGSEDIRGQIKDILLGLNDAVNREEMDLGGIYEVEFIEGLIRIYSCAVLDSNSFYSPVEGRKEFKPQTIEVHEPDDLLRQEKLRRMVEKMQRALSPDKINAYVELQLGERSEMLATELPLDQVEDFVKVIYTRLYGQRKNMKYQIEVMEETQINGFSFKDYVIRRK
ncbi:MAG: Wadjet anti-phage system protein JetA family protein [Lachnospiraceae bacterium]